MPDRPSCVLVLVLVLALVLVGCARSRGPEPEVPDLFDDADAEELAHEVEGRTVDRFHAAVSEAEYLHEDQRPAPCAVAARELERMIAAGHPSGTESARLYRVCGCCLGSRE